MKGFKAFDKDWKCRGKQYAVGETFTEDVTPKVCGQGMHFCEKLSDVFRYYDFNPDKTNVAEVEALGEISTDGVKSCTNKLHIIREMSWDEVLKACNTGNCNTGNCNTGDRNTGNCNTGNCNTGDRNTGDRNTGDWNTGDWNTGNCNTGNCNTGDWNTGNCNTGDRNTGDRNTGDRNTGDRNTGDRNTGDWNTGNCNTGNCNTGDWNTGNCNTGDRNTGDRNTGDRNTGDWNYSSFNNGCFMTEEPKIMLFNKQSDWTYRDWRNSRACALMNQIPKKVVEWVCTSEMTDEEKLQHPEYKTTDGYLKVLDESENAQIWWDGLDDGDKNCIRTLPNFDGEIFRKCTGIRV